MHETTFFNCMKTAPQNCVYSVCEKQYINYICGHTLKGKPPYRGIARAHIFCLESIIIMRESVVLLVQLRPNFYNQVIVVDSKGVHKKGPVLASLMKLDLLTS